MSKKYFDWLTSPKVRDCPLHIIYDKKQKKTPDSTPVCGLKLKAVNYSYYKLCYLIIQFIYIAKHL